MSQTHIAKFEKAAKSFKGAATSMKKQMQIMLVSGVEHLVSTKQGGKGGDATLLTRAFYLAREHKVIRASEIIPYLAKFGGVAFDTSDKRKTDVFKLGQFVPVNGADISTVQMNAEPWYEFAKPEADPKPLDLVARLMQLAKDINKHKENPVEGDNLPEDLATLILAAATPSEMAQA